tara:strand:+ start:510 stop:1262 length:753 start_codon:yes stop_codon:yes gene_type:complete
MAKFLLKKSYQLNNLKLIKYDDLWGAKGIFTTIRVIGKKPKFILFNNHIDNMNKALKKININFVVTKKLILELLQPQLNKLKDKDCLLRIAVSNNKISLSIRLRLNPQKNFVGILYSFQRKMPKLKNLYYKKIIKLLSSINLEKKEIILISKGILLEGCTTNIFCVYNKIIYMPSKNYYRGITMDYLLKKNKRKVKKIDIPIKSLNKYEEIFLVGSGKGVLRLKSIPEINWKSRSDLIYKEFKRSYKKIL